MNKSYVTKSPINFVQSSFRVNAGDILVHDTVNQKLTVYRGGQIVKVMKQSAIGMTALVKDRSADEIVEHKSASLPAVGHAIDPAETQRMLKNVPKLKQDLSKAIPAKPSKEELQQKRKKAQPTEVSIETLPSHLQELAKKPTKEDEGEAS